jgi:hypothetical protein
MVFGMDRSPVNVDICPWFSTFGFSKVLFANPEQRPNFVARFENPGLLPAEKNLNY